MTTAQKLMFGFGLAALLIGANVLAVRTSRETERYARRMGGIMLLALGACLALFAIGLAGSLEG